MGKNYSFNTNKESLKNQKLSDYEIMDFVSNHIDLTQKDSMIDRIMDCIKDAKIDNHKYQTQRLKDII